MRDEGGYRKEREREREAEETREEFERPRARSHERVFGPAGGGSGQIWIGLVIVTFGLALLLDNLGIIGSSRSILRFWPLILVFAGANDLFHATARGRAMRGVILASVGILFLLNNLNIVDVRIWDLWPLFLIVIGFKMLIRRRPVPGPASENPFETVETGDESEFDDSAFLGGVKRSVTSQKFRGGAATAFMGGVELNLRRAQMEGKSAVINVFAIMGGVSLRVPEGWRIESRISCIMGSVDDKTMPDPNAEHTLVLEGSVFMGGVEIKD